MRHLAVLLLAPWLLILCWAFWAYPKSLPRSAGRRVFDVLSILLVCGAAVTAASFGFDRVELPPTGALGRVSGAIWQQVLPALCGYGAFSVTLALAMWVRYLVWGRHKRDCADATVV